MHRRRARRRSGRDRRSTRPPTRWPRPRSSLARRLAAHGGLLASVDGDARPARWCSTRSAARCTSAASGSSPASRATGSRRPLVDAAVEAAEGYDDLTVVAREELPDTIGFWERQGFREVRRESPERRAAPPAAHRGLPGARRRGDARPRPVARRPAGAPATWSCSPASSGPARRRSPRGSAPGSASAAPVTSPTFVIARVHPSEVGGPALVHVDAYRLGGLAELDDLDLDTSLDEAVTVVEWGEGLAEGLAESRLEVDIVRNERRGRAPARRDHAGRPALAGALVARTG